MNPNKNDKNSIKTHKTLNQHNHYYQPLQATRQSKDLAHNAQAAKQQALQTRKSCTILDTTPNISTTHKYTNLQITHPSYHKTCLYETRQKQKPTIGAANVPSAKQNSRLRNTYTITLS
jgi:hypothetical protein